MDSEAHQYAEHGFSNESLRMLDSEEGQLNAVFACFGSAAQHGQLFEQGLTRFLMVCSKAGLVSISNIDTTNKMTMGQLFREVRKHVTIIDNWVEEDFLTAIQQRNFLIHRFFLERSAQLRSSSGRVELLNELVSMELNLDRCHTLINAMRIAMCRTLGITDDWAYEYTADTPGDS